MKRSALGHVVILILAGLAAAADLPDYKATYEASLEEIVLAHGAAMTRLVQQYSRALEAMLVRARKSGDLDRTTALVVELERFKARQEMPAVSPASRELAEMQASYSRQANGHALEQARKVLILVTQYDQALERLQRQWVTDDQLEAARGVQSERDAAARREVVVRARALLQDAVRPAPAGEADLDEDEPQDEQAVPVTVPAPSRRRLVLHYAFEGAEGMTVEDLSGDRNHGSLLGAQRVAEGRFGQGCAFREGASLDATDFAVGDNFTISLWVNLHSTANGQCLVGKHTTSGFNLLVFSIWDNGYHVCIRNHTAQAGTVKTGWQHLVVVGKTRGMATDVTVYRDGQELWSRRFDTVLGDTAGKAWTFGQDWDAQTRTDFLNGTLDEILIYKRAFSEKDVGELYRSYPGAL